MMFPVRAASRAALCCSMALSAGACAAAVAPAAPAQPRTPDETPLVVQSCEPVGQRAGREFGCYIIASQPIGPLGTGPVSWYLDQFPDRAAADAARGTHGTVVESFGHVWMLSIEAAGWQGHGGTRIAEVGPLPVEPGVSYTAQYMEAVFRPGMKSSVHRHGGPEAWYTLAGETCLETPDGTMVGRAGGSHVIVPHGPPMELTATGASTRRALVLVLHDSSLPSTTAESVWRPRGLCTVSPAR